MRVTQLWRYPVKSMQGERLEAATIADRGIVGDRHWAIVNLTTGLTLTARREPRLLFAQAHFVDPDTVQITLPDGQVATSNEQLSAWLGHDAELRRAVTPEPGTFEIALDFEHEDTADWMTWEGPVGSFHDSGKTQVSLASEATFRDWEERRFRINVIVDGSGEDDLVGRQLRLGEVTLDVTKPIDRCVMTTRPQPGGIERNLDVLRTINAERGGMLGIGTLVVTGGEVRVGDEVVAA